MKIIPVATYIFLENKISRNFGATLTKPFTRKISNLRRSGLMSKDFRNVSCALVFK